MLHQVKLTTETLEETLVKHSDNRLYKNVNHWSVSLIISSYFIQCGKSRKHVCVCVSTTKGME